MRGSVVFLAVFAVSSCSVGVNGAHFVKSGITGHGTRRGNEDALGVEESAFGNGESGGHYIWNRSNFGHDIAKQAALSPAAARRRGVIESRAPFPYPILPPKFPIHIPPLPIVEVPPSDLLNPILPPMLPMKPRPQVKPRDQPLRGAMPSGLEREVRPLPALRFPPLSKVKDEAMKIISNTIPGAHILPAILPKPWARRSLAPSQDFYRSNLENRRSRYSGSRRYSPSRSYQTLPGPLIDDFVAMPLYKHVRNTAPIQPGAEENIGKEVRSAIIISLVQLWKKILQLFKPGSSSGGNTGALLPMDHIPIGGGNTGALLPMDHIPIGGGNMGALPPVEHIPVGGGNMGALPPIEHIPIGGGKEFGPSLPVEPEVHTERPPDEYYDDVIIEPVTPPVYDDGVETIHLLAEEDDSKPPEDSTEEGGNDYDSDYEPIYPNYAHQQTNWEVHRGMGKEDVARKSKDPSAGTRRKNTRDDLDTVTNIFGRLADD